MIIVVTTVDFFMGAIGPFETDGAARSFLEHQGWKDQESMGWTKPNVHGSHQTHDKAHILAMKEPEELAVAG